MADGLSILYQLWRNELAPAALPGALSEITSLIACINDLKQASSAGTVQHTYSTEQLSTTDLETLRDRMSALDPGSPVPDAVTELAGDCIERLSRQRVSDIDRSARGHQHTVPLSTAVSKGVTCLATVRDRRADLFGPREAKSAIDDLAQMLPQMPEAQRKQFGLTVSREGVDALRALSASLHEEREVAAVGEKSSELARAALRALLGADDRV
jgi:hypothetical protein